MLRLMQNRVRMNLIEIDEGKPAQKEGEIVLEKRYCEEHGYTVGDGIRAAGREFVIVGIGTTPDYDLPVASLSDMSAESALFGTAFVTKAQYEKVVEEDGTRGEEYTYAYRLEDGKGRWDSSRALW